MASVDGDVATCGWPDGDVASQDTCEGAFLPLETWPAVVGQRSANSVPGDVAKCDWPEDCRRRRAIAARWELYCY